MIRRGYADGPYGQIHFQDAGAGAPVILLHQAPMTSGQFDSVYAPLAARGARAIGIDMAGFGMSDPPPSPPAIEDYAQGVIPVLDALAIDRAAVLGHHTGALVATELAIAMPHRVSALILNGPLPLTDAERAAYLAESAWEHAFAARAGGAHLTDLFAIRERFAAGSVPPERISDYVVQALVGRGEFWYGHRAAYRYRQAERLAEVRQRALILTNTGDIIHALALRARELRPDFAFAELRGGGIDIVDQQPEAWAEIVADFVLARQ